MKHAYIGLVALATVLIAGCGGSSDNGNGDGMGGTDGAKSTLVNLNGVTGFTVGDDNTSETTLAEGEHNGPNGSKITCEPAEGSTGCTFSVTKDSVIPGRYIAMATGGTITVTPGTMPKTDPPKTDSDKPKMDSDDKKPSDTAKNQPPQTYTVRNLPARHGLTLGQVYRVSSGGSGLPIAVSGGTTTLSCPSSAGADGCTLTVTSSGATSTGGLVDVSFAATPAPTQPTNTVTREQNERDKNTANQQGQEVGRQQGQEQAEVKLRLPNLLTSVAGTASNGTDDGEADGVVSVDTKKGTIKFGVGDLSAISASGTSRFSSNGFSGSAFTNNLGARDNTYYLYTSIDKSDTAASSRAFWKIHGSRVADMSGNVPSITPSETLVSIARGSSAVAQKVKDAVQARIDDTEDDFSTDDLTDADYTTASSGAYARVVLRGSLGQTSGRFVCATNCGNSTHIGTINTDDYVTFEDGKPTFVTAADWRFTPDRITDPHQRPRDDTYLYFGMWGNEPDEPSGSTPSFIWLRGGGSTLSDLNMLEGTANFKGGAIGKYAISETARGESAKAGIFTATATLTANFGTLADDDTNTLSGTIAGFHDEKGAPLDAEREWKLSLRGDRTANPVPQAALGSTGATTGTLHVLGKIDGVDVNAGAWAATLHGADNMPAPSSLSDADKARQCQNGCGADLEGVVGTFNATGASSSFAIGGAFGAAKQ